MTDSIKKFNHPPAREDIPTLSSLGVSLHPDALMFVEDSQTLANAIGGNGEWPMLIDPKKSIKR
jgi:hypothetical protein